MQRYRVGVIGCGRIASTIEDEIKDGYGTRLLPYSHAGAYKDVPEVELVAAADVAEKSLADFGGRWGVNSLYASYEQMLERERLDIVSIAASTSVHYAATMKAVEAGVKAIFCEKPIAETLGEADRMIAACDRAGVKLVVDHTRRWDPYYRKAKQLVDSGRIGELLAITGYNSEPLLYGGTHLYDLFRYFGGDVDWVYGHIGDIRYLDEEKTVCRDPTGQGAAVLHFKSGLHGSVAMANLFEMDLVGKSGRIRTSAVPFELYEGDRLVRFPAVMKHTSGMVNAVREIVECIETGKESISNGREGRAALEIALALVESQRTGGRAVKLPLADTGVRITMAGGIFR